jgi:hypothetical protein
MIRLEALRSALAKLDPSSGTKKAAPAVQPAPCGSHAQPGRLEGEGDDLRGVTLWALRIPAITKARQIPKLPRALL